MAAALAPAAAIADATVNYIAAAATIAAATATAAAAAATASATAHGLRFVMCVARGNGMVRYGLAWHGVLAQYSKLTT